MLLIRQGQFFQVIKRKLNLPKFSASVDGDDSQHESNDDHDAGLLTEHTNSHFDSRGKQCKAGEGNLVESSESAHVGQKHYDSAQQTSGAQHARMAWWHSHRVDNWVLQHKLGTRSS